MTFDDDFLSLVEGEGLEHAGIVYVRQKGRQIGDAVNATDAHLHERSDDYSIEYFSGLSSSSHVRVVYPELYFVSGRVERVGRVR
jgi:hypothetical protein